MEDVFIYKEIDLLFLNFKVYLHLTLNICNPISISTLHQWSVQNHYLSKNSKPGFHWIL